MLEITKITEIDNKRHIALMDTSSISFMQGLQTKGLQPETVLKDYEGNLYQIVLASTRQIARIRSYFDIDRIADRIYLVNGEALTYTVRNKKEIVAKLEITDYSPEIDTYLKVICFPTFPGHCGCILFNIEDIRFTKSSGDAEKALMLYLQNED